MTDREIGETLATALADLMIQVPIKQNSRTACEAVENCHIALDAARRHGYKAASAGLPATPEKRWPSRAKATPREEA